MHTHIKITGTKSGIVALNKLVIMSPKQDSLYSISILPTQYLKCNIAKITDGGKPVRSNFTKFYRRNPI